jgi:hypothetical protein
LSGTNEPEASGVSPIDFYEYSVRMVDVKLQHNALNFLAGEAEDGH